MHKVTIENIQKIVRVLDCARLDQLELKRCPEFLLAGNLTIDEEIAREILDLPKHRVEAMHNRIDTGANGSLRCSEVIAVVSDYGCLADPLTLRCSLKGYEVFSVILRPLVAFLCERSKVLRRHDPSREGADIRCRIVRTGDSINPSVILSTTCWRTRSIAHDHQTARLALVNINHAEPLSFVDEGIVSHT